MMNAPNINTLWAHAIVDELARSGLRTVVISPGSRSTPLVLQFHAHPDIHDISIVDERAAAFFALGIARATTRPVALLCTSGTAAANYLPAICEAHQSNIPLLVLTADRPLELHGCGAPQTMHQQNLYQNHVRAFHQLATPEPTPAKLHGLRATICRAFAHTHGRTPQNTRPGPVHINIPFDKPLEPTPVAPDHRHHVPAQLTADAPAAVFGRAHNQPYLQIFSATAAPEPHTIQAFANLLLAAKRPLFLAGADNSTACYRDNLRKLAEHIRAPIAAEPTSNLRHWNQRGPNTLPADIVFQTDLYTTAGQAAAHTTAPDLIIRTGQAPLHWTSQKLIASLPETPQLIVGPHLEIPDPDHLASHHFACDENLLFEQTLTALKTLQPAQSTDENWLAQHQHAHKSAIQTLHNLLLDTPQITAPGLWFALGNLLPEDSALFVSASMPVRDLDTFMSHATQSLNIHFNRGINGIDGIIATGLGIAAARNQHTVVVTGDIALRHDLSSLLLAHELNLNATIIVIDNGGGAIFERLPIANNPDLSTTSSQNTLHTAFQQHFITRPALSIPQMLPRAIEYSHPLNWPEFNQAFTSSLKASGLQLIHLQTSRTDDQNLTRKLTTLLKTSLQTSTNPSTTA